MFDIGFMELLVIGALALIVVGPKELPGLLRTVGQYAGKARAMARDFQRTMEDAAREADLGDVADAVKKGGKLNKLPFDNQVVNSIKDFERTVRTEVNDAARAGHAATAPAAPKPVAPAAATAAQAATTAPTAAAQPAAAPTVTPAPAPAATPETADTTKSG